jgi:hypothetical protein
MERNVSIFGRGLVDNGMHAYNQKMAQYVTISKELTTANTVEDINIIAAKLRKLLAEVSKETLCKK